MIKVVMKEAEDILINGNDIESFSDEYHVNVKNFNGILTSQKTIAIFKRKDVKMIYEIPESKEEGDSC